MLHHLNAQIDALAMDHLHGASEIVYHALELFGEITQISDQNPHVGEKLFQRAVRRLAQGQPSMAPILNLLNDICLLRESVDEDWTEFKIRFNQLKSAFHEKVDGLLDHLNQLPRSQSALMTFSNSSTVSRVIISCFQEYGWPARVLCSEGRPRQEGLNLALKLKQAGIKVSLFTDAALMSQISTVESVWIGGDSLSHEGLVNKVGSGALAMLAMMQGISFISLLSTDKLLSPSLLPYFRFLPQNPREITADEFKGIDVVNEYYEVLPLELITFVYTEKGLQNPKELIHQFEAKPLSSLFCQIVQEPL